MHNSESLKSTLILILNNVRCYSVVFLASELNSADKSVITLSATSN